MALHSVLIAVKILPDVSTEELDRMGKPRYVKTLVPVSDGNITIYAGVRVANALQEVTKEMDLYQGVKLTELVEAVYQQGKKDGARAVQVSFEHVMRDIPHLNPGQPKKKKKK
jgi:hypothetical protein